MMCLWPGRLFFKEKWKKKLKINDHLYVNNHKISLPIFCFLQSTCTCMDANGLSIQYHTFYLTRKLAANCIISDINFFRSPKHMFERATDNMADKRLLANGGGLFRYSAPSSTYKIPCSNCLFKHAIINTHFSVM